MTTSTKRPDGGELKRNQVLSFDDGLLTVRISGHGEGNGWGSIAFHERQIEIDPDGFHTAEIPPSELRALRDFLNRVFPCTPTNESPAPQAKKDSPMATILHDSDCAVHNEPAYPNGPCDCGAAPQPPVEGLREALKEAIDVFEGMNDDEINEELLPRLKAALASPSLTAGPKMPANLHPRTLDLVQRFAVALAKKLRLAEEKYGFGDGWAEDNWEQECRAHFLSHIEKGDPRDVAAYCAFMWHHGWITTSPAPATLIEQSGQKL